MAAAHSPDRATFLFVDYKGGAAFADCVALPHTVGLVTDLSPHLVRRALTSLRAELRYREHLLNRKKAKDLVSLEKTGDPETPPSLLIVVDEFAALVQEVPEFVDGVVDVAQRGRSLGLHLILATQRPAGVIKDNLRANTNLRIALRMADAEDSSDILGTPMAAYFDQSIPGRGAAKTGPGRLGAFQTGYAGGWTTNEPPRPRIDISEMNFGAGAEWEVPEVEVVEAADPGPNDIARLVAIHSHGGPPGRHPRPAQAVARRTRGRLRLLAAAEPAHRRAAAARRDRRAREPDPADRVLRARPRRQHGRLRHGWIGQERHPAHDRRRRGDHASRGARCTSTASTSDRADSACSRSCPTWARSSTATTRSASSAC